MIDLSLTFVSDVSYLLRRDYNFFAMGRDRNYFDYEATKYHLDLFCNNAYLPSNKVLLDAIKEYSKDFAVNFAVGNTLIEMLENERPDVLASFIELFESDSVELLASTGYNSLASLYHEKEFIAQIKAHGQLMKTHFNQVPKIFVNSSLMYSNDMSSTLAQNNFNTLLIEGTENILGWRSQNFVYQSTPQFKQKLLLRNPFLSNAITFKFSDSTWNEYPLTAEKFVGWIHELDKKTQAVNIVLNYKTLGCYQPLHSGILPFLSKVIELVAKSRTIKFSKLSSISKNHDPVAKLDVEYPISWSGAEKDVSLWTGNELQKASGDFLYNLEPKIKKKNDVELLKNWRQIQNALYFEYMDTRWKSTGFNPQRVNNFKTPEEAFIIYNNILNDISYRI